MSGSPAAEPPVAAALDSPVASVASLSTDDASLATSDSTDAAADVASDATDSAAEVASAAALVADELSLSSSPHAAPTTASPSTITASRPHRRSLLPSLVRCIRASLESPRRPRRSSCSGGVAGPTLTYLREPSLARPSLGPSRPPPSLLRTSARAVPRDYVPPGSVAGVGGGTAGVCGRRRRSLTIA